MKAIRLHSFGKSDQLHLEDIPQPAPKAGEVLIRVHAASVNPVDYKIRSGEFKSGDLKLPLTLGRDISGVVEAVGANVSQVAVGDAVYVLLDLDHGGYAEYVIAQAEDTAPKPATLDHIHAAAVPLAALTAWQGIFDHGKLKSGERVLIHGAAGGVGQFAVQFAKVRGAEVIATAREENRELLLDLGADEVIDYEHEKFEEEVDEVDLVFDLVAGETQQRSWKCLKHGGRMVSTLKAPSKVKALFHGAKGEVFMAAASGHQLKEIGQMIDAGQVKVTVEQTLALEQAGRAQDHLEHDHPAGKVVLEV
jgi:NADPH:quinone reductase-like Zn-dependent oxidoreductase